MGEFFLAMHGIGKKWKRNSSTKIFLHTHELINLHISAMAYYINTLGGERSVHGRCEPKCFKDGDLF